jgi:SAM-dependent methyltransferase
MTKINVSSSDLEDQHGSRILSEMEHARRFNFWMGKTLRPFIGDRVLEIGAGIGTLTNQFIPRERYVASDINPHYLRYLQSYSFGKPYLHVVKVDAGNREDFNGFEEKFDTALMINVLEHVPDEGVALRNLWSSLEAGGRAVILVPQHPSLYGSLDEVLLHRERYTAATLQSALTDAGFRIEKMFDFNRVSVPGWWLNGKVLRRKRFSRIQLKILDLVMPLLSRVDRLWPWRGLSLIAVGVKDEGQETQVEVAQSGRGQWVDSSVGGFKSPPPHPTNVTRGSKPTLSNGSASDRFQLTVLVS